MSTPERLPASTAEGPQDAPARPKKGPPPATPFAVKPVSALWVFLAVNFMSALFSPIDDCDETFNYWEPTHYLSHGYGLQTWEYSPEYSIRSWLYAAIHAFLGCYRRMLPFPNKVAEFYFVRYSLAFFCAVCQTQLFRVISITLNPRIALFYLMAMVFSPGMFRASTAFLPSSFAMCTTMMAMAAFINWRGGLKTTRGIFWLALGGILGWPFSIAIATPFLVEEVVLAVLASRDAMASAVKRFARGIAASLAVLLLEFAVSSFFYRRAELVPLNIVLYNVFSGEGRGPSIYGTEPWHFYMRNLLLNFNMWFVLALAALPLFGLHRLFSERKVSAQTGLRTIVFMSPFYLWLAIFSIQPHKEERFMYPAYPALALNAAMSMHIILATVGQADQRTLIGKIPAQLKLIVIVTCVATSLNLGLSRIYGMYEGYSAPMRIYSDLWDGGSSAAPPAASVCFGKDWYRFPSSYFLPNGVKAKFIKSEFDGLLPGEFAEATPASGFRPGTWMTPSGMNDVNEEDAGKYTDIETCDYLVDTFFPGSQTSALEPAYMLDSENWETVRCERLLDAAKTHVLERALWLPIDVPGFQRQYGQHCLLRRKSPISPELKEEL